MHEDAEVSQDYNEDLLNKVRNFTNDLLSDGEDAAEVAHFLSFTSAQMGLSITNNSTETFLPILQGLIIATEMANKAAKEEENPIELDAEDFESNGNQSVSQRKTKPNLTIVH